MTFDTKEISTSGSRPVELYEFTLGSDAYRYVASDNTYSYLTQTYYPTQITRSSSVTGREESQENLSVTLPRQNAIVSRYLQNPPGVKCVLNIYRTQIGETDGILVFKGLAKAIVFSADGASATITCAPLTVGLSRLIPRYTYSTPCNFVLFDSNCGVKESKFTRRLRITAVNGTTLTIALAGGLGNNYYKGGWLSVPDTGEHVLILRQTGDSVGILRPVNGLEVGALVDMKAGCPHTMTACNTKFNNAANYGGFAYVPTRNVFRSGIQQNPDETPRGRGGIGY